MLLNLLNLFSLIIALFKKIYSMNQQLDVLRHCGIQEKGLKRVNATAKYLTTTVPSIFQKATNELFPSLSDLSTMATTMFTDNLESTTKKCRIFVNCSKITKTTTMVSALAFSSTTTMLPEMTLNGTEINGTTYFEPTMDYFNLSTTDSDYFDENSTGSVYNTTVDLNSLLAMTTTTELPFETTTEDYENSYDDNGKFDCLIGDFHDKTLLFYSLDDYSSAESEGDRLRRSLYDYQLHNITFDDYENTTNFDPDNTTDFNTSTTDFSFLENSTVTLDNESTSSSQWTEFSSTITTEMDNFETDDENDAQVEDPKCINNPDGFYYKECDENESDSDWTTPTESNDVPEEIRMALATVTSFSDIPTTVMNATNDSFSTNATLLAAKTKAQECVPFLPNRGDNITGIPPEYVGAQLSKTIQTMNQQNQQKLRDLCWETLFGQELVKLTVLDLIFTIFATLFMDFFRALFVRFMNKCWCWDLEKKFPKVTIFQIEQYHQFYKYLIFFRSTVWRL